VEESSHHIPNAKEFATWELEHVYIGSCDLVSASQCHHYLKLIINFSVVTFFILSFLHLLTCVYIVWAIFPYPAPPCGYFYIVCCTFMNCTSTLLFKLYKRDKVEVIYFFYLFLFKIDPPLSLVIRWNRLIKEVSRAGRVAQIVG
jgi:hypothetical protein